jgi:N-acetylmuramoyl-L-alanine amidase
MPRYGIDFGHGGHDSGAVAKGLVEKDINLYIGLKIKYHITRHGQPCFATRVDDTTLDLNERARLINAFNPDYVLSTHENAGGGDGYDVIYSKVEGVSLELANRIAAEFDAIGQNKHRVFCRLGDDGRDYYAMIRMIKAPSVISEFAFLDSADSAAVDEQCEWDKIARALAKALLEQGGVTWIEERSDVPVENVVLPFGPADIAACEIVARWKNLKVRYTKGDILPGDVVLQIGGREPLVSGARVISGNDALHTAYLTLVDCGFNPANY